MIPDGTRVPVPRRVDRIHPNQFELGTLRIIVFGPGRGEAIVVMLPDGRVGVVDGCREPDPDDATGRGDPVREFLNEVALTHPGGPDTFRLAFVCLTHPHDDHYGGTGRLLKAFRGRVDEVWQPHYNERYAKDLDEYVKQTRAGREDLPDDVMVKGLTRVIDELTRAQKDTSECKYLSGNKKLLESEVNGQPLDVLACGPADRDLDQAQRDMVLALQELRDGKAPRRTDPNLVSGAIVIRWGEARALLAGDLLCSAHRYSGWSAASRHITGPVQVVNVAHHASHEAHHSPLWERMKPALALVTPFKNASGDNPPRPEKILHLAGNSVVAITTPPSWPAAPGNPIPWNMPPRTPSDLGSRNTALRLSPSGGSDNAIRNAVGVALDEKGQILSFVLAGEAAIYIAPVCDT